MTRNDVIQISGFLTQVIIHFREYKIMSIILAGIIFPTNFQKRKTCNVIMVGNDAIPLPNLSMILNQKIFVLFFQLISRQPRYGSSGFNSDFGKILRADAVSYTIKVDFYLDLAITCRMTSTIQNI